MRTVASCTIALLLGSAIGWYVAHSREKYQPAEVVEFALQGAESSEASGVARAIEAIRLIASGDTNEAVQKLSAPVAHYYVLYKSYAGENRRRADLCAAIEKLMKTNAIVAHAVKERIELNRLTPTPAK